MAVQCCQDFDLKGELDKGAIPSEAPVVKPRKRGKAGRRSIDTINTSKMRGANRGFGTSTGFKNI